MTVGPGYVFLCVARTASVAISRHWLIDHYNGEELNPDDYHIQTVLPEHAHKFTFAVVRNPYTRMASLWRYVGQFTETQRKAIYAESGISVTPSLAQFVDWCWRSGVVGTQWLSQAEFLSRARVDRVLRFEHLEEGLRGLPFVLEWHPPPFVNATERPFRLADLSPDAIRAINHHSREDFAAFNYSMIREASDLCV